VAGAIEASAACPELDLWPEHLAMVAWFWQRVGHSPAEGPLLDVGRRLLFGAAELRPRDLAMALHAVCHLRAPVAVQFLLVCEDRLVGAAQRRPDGRLPLAPAGMSQVMGAYVALGRAPLPALVSALETGAVANMDRFGCPLLSKTLGSYCRLGLQPGAELWEALVDHTGHAMAEIEPRTLSALLRSFGILRRSPGDPWLERAGAAFLACSRDFSLIDLGLFLWGFAKLGVRPSAAVLDEHTACVVRSLTPPALAGPSGATPKAGSHPAEAKLGAPTLRERRTSVNQVVYAHAKLGNVPVRPDAAALFLDSFRDQLADGGDLSHTIPTMLWSLSRLKVQLPPDILRRLEEVLPDQIGGFTPQGIFNSLWALGNSADDRTRPPAAFLDLFLRAACEQLEYFKPSELAMTFWSFGKLKHRLEPEPLQTIQAKLLPQALELSLEEVLCVLYGAACIDNCPEPLFFGQFLRQALAMSEQWTPESVSLLSWILGKAGHAPGETFLRELEAAVTRHAAELSPQGTANVLWGTAKLERPLPPELLETLQGVALGFLEAGTLQGSNLADAAWALHRHCPPAANGGDGGRASAVFELLGQEAVLQAGAMTPQQLACCLIVLASRGWSPTPEELEAVARVTVLHLRQGAPAVESLGFFAWGFAKMNRYPGRAWEDEVVRCIEAHGAVASPRCITNLMWFYARLNCVPGPEVAAVVAAHSEGRSEEYTDTLSRNLVWAAARLKFGLGPRALARAEAATLPHLGLYAPFALESLLWGFVSLGYGPSGAWLEAFDAACLARCAGFDERLVMQLLLLHARLSRLPPPPLLEGLFSQIEAPLGAALEGACGIDMRDEELLERHAGSALPTLAVGEGGLTLVVAEAEAPPAAGSWSESGAGRDSLPWDEEVCRDDFPEHLYTLLAAFAHLGHARSAQLLSAVHARRAAEPGEEGDMEEVWPQPQDRTPSGPAKDVAGREGDAGRASRRAAGLAPGAEEVLAAWDSLCGGSGGPAAAGGGGPGPGAAP